MKIIFSFCLLLLGCSASLDLFGQTASSRPQWLGHLSANPQFRSEILLRNDGFDRSLSVLLELFDSDGLPAQVALSLDGGEPQTVDQLALILAPLESQALVLNSVTSGDGRSIQARITPSEQAPLAVEANFSRFEGGEKVAKVGVPVISPGKVFRINVDNGVDPVSGLAEIRGLGIADTDDLNSCECLLTLVDERGLPLAGSLITIPPRGKWLGVIGDLFADTNGLLSGRGYLDALCSEPVSVLALSFEGKLMSTVPVTVYQLP